MALVNDRTHMDVINNALGDYILNCNAHISEARHLGDIDKFLYWTREVELAHQSRDMLTKRSA